jgi:hypothetical protein
MPVGHPGRTVAAKRQSGAAHGLAAHWSADGGPHGGWPGRLHRQYLVRIGDDRIETCSLWPVWVLLDELSKDGPTGYALDTLQYTVREKGESGLMVFISKPEEMRDFLEVALPELASACDQGDGGFEWIEFERAPPQPEAEPESLD